MTNSKKILVLYSSHDGHTRTIAQRLADTLGEGAGCDVLDLHRSEEVDPGLYGGVVIGAAVRYGRYNPAVERFIRKNHGALSVMPNAFFGVNLIARKPEKRLLENNVYTRKFLARSPWKPALVEIFAGALRYPHYRWIDRIAIQMIMRMTGGETDPTKEIVYTDWEQVDNFARRFAGMAGK